MLKKINKAGYQAYLVGGGVRDLLLHVAPKDFDVATNATPEQVKKLFRNCRLIGKRFRLAHVHFGREIIEVATFRSLSSGQTKSKQSAMIWRDNQYGTLAEDAFRRDFTLNALYYNIADFSIVDYHHGVKDIESRLIRIIGEPTERYAEDPVRMLRAVRFAAKLEFEIEAETGAPIEKMRHSLSEVSNARLFEEFAKLFHSGHAVRTFRLLRDYRLFEILFPSVNKKLQAQPEILTLFEGCLASTDQRVAAQKPITPAFLFAALLWPDLQERKEELQSEQRLSLHQAVENAAREILSAQAKIVSIPKRLMIVIKEIWHHQFRLENRHAERSAKLLMHGRFRAAYDFLLLRAQAGEVATDLAEWWTEIQSVDQDAQATMLAEFKVKRPRRRRKKSS